jgi:hypothetical protein
VEKINIKRGKIKAEPGLHIKVGAGQKLILFGIELQLSSSRL